MNLRLRFAEESLQFLACKKAHFALHKVGGRRTQRATQDAKRVGVVLPLTMQKILLIEDDPHALEMLRFRFRKAGYQVAEALDGDDGLLKALHKPDLIFLDLRLPKIDGWELCRILRSDERTRNIPIVMLTGCSQPLQKEYGKQCGADAYLTKPWNPKELMSVARRLLKSKGETDE